MSETRKARVDEEDLDDLDGLLDTWVPVVYAHTTMKYRCPRAVLGPTSKGTHTITAVYCSDIIFSHKRSCFVEF